jgi:hypothetical protein
MTLQAVVVGPVSIEGAGDAPAQVLFPVMSWAVPAGGVTTITTAGVAQTLAAARVNRTGWLLQNLDTSNDLWVDDTNIPVANACICVPAGSMFVCPENMVTSGVLRVLGLVAAQKFVFRESYL